MDPRVTGEVLYFYRDHIEAKNIGIAINISKWYLLNIKFKLFVFFIDTLVAIFSSGENIPQKLKILLEKLILKYGSIYNLFVTQQV